MWGVGGSKRWTLNGPWYGDKNGVFRGPTGTHTCVVDDNSCDTSLSRDSPPCHTGGIDRSRRIFCRKSATKAGYAAISPSDDTNNSPGKRSGSPNTI